MMPFLGIFGHVNIDYLFDVPCLPKPDHTIQVLKHMRCFGGTGANLAVLASGLGVSTSLVSFVGDDFPLDYYTWLRKNGVDITDLNVVKGKSTPTCWIFTAKKGEQITIIDQGAMNGVSKLPVAEHTIDSSSVIHITTGCPRYYLKVKRFALKRKKKVSFDPGQELSYIYELKIFKEMIKGCNYFFANRVETSLALRYLGLKKKEELLDFVRVLVLTRGREGSRIITDEEWIDIPPIAPKKMVDVTGAGDGYRAGFYAALSRRKDLETCGLAGAATASFVVEHFGIQERLPTWEMVMERVERARKT